MQTGKTDILELLDRAKTQWYHVRTIFISGVGFFTDAYDLFCISTVTELLGHIYYPQESSVSIPIHVLDTIVGAALLGTIFGSCFFGWLGDTMGRRKAYGITLVLMIFASIGSGLSFGSSPGAVMGGICFFRFWLGFGIGGDYPLSATIMSEYSSVSTRGAFLGAVFSLQGLGILCGASIAMVVARIFPENYADFVWRIILMFGAVPAAVTLYYRLKMPESPRFTALVRADVPMASEHMSKVLKTQLDLEQHNFDTTQVKILSRDFARKYGLQLLGTCSCWFLLDVTFYSQTLFQKNIYRTVGLLAPANRFKPLNAVYLISRAQAIVTVIATMPGYMLSVFLLDRIGRRVIQLQGFFVLTILTGLSARIYQRCASDSCSWHENLGFVVIYALIFFFSNFGPNMTTFLVPAELFPARLRSTCYGLAAACGKAGALAGTLGITYRPGTVRVQFIILSVLNAIGVLATYALIPETKCKTLEELSGELNQRNARGEGSSDEVCSSSSSSSAGRALLRAS